MTSTSLISMYAMSLTKASENLLYGFYFLAPAATNSLWVYNNSVL